MIDDFVFWMGVLFSIVIGIFISPPTGVLVFLMLIFYAFIKEVEKYD